MLRLDRINRLELIGDVRQVLWVQSDHRTPKRLEVSLQDEGRTLKLFLVDSDNPDPELYPPENGKMD